MGVERVLIVTGGRTYNNTHFLHSKLEEWEPDLIVHGGAKGADEIAFVWARTNGVAVASFFVSNKQWGVYGKYAGPMRNGQMIDFVKMMVPYDSATASYLWEYGHPLVEGIVFPGGPGTNDMCQKMTEAGIVWWDYRDDPLGGLLPQGIMAPVSRRL